MNIVRNKMSQFTSMYNSLDKFLVKMVDVSLKILNRVLNKECDRDTMFDFWMDMSLTRIKRYEYRYVCPLTDDLEKYVQKYENDMVTDDLSTNIFRTIEDFE